MPNNHCPLILFILKRFQDYDYDHHHHHHHPHPISNGLRNSAQIIVDLLLSEGHRAKLVDAIDGNCIDRLVNENQPTRVVIEALWVTPEKMAELQKLWPKVKWTIRIHSEIPFLNTEGIALDWITKYANQGIEVAFNSQRTAHDFNVLIRPTHLPNYYPLRKPRPSKPCSNVLDIGCFGAIRPMKNQLMQAFAAVRFARIQGKQLRFHMNGSRQEQGGNNCLKNITVLLATAGAELVLHPWYEHEDFLELISTMDIVLQVSFNETFCITAADAVSMGVPLVGSKEIPWLSEFSVADPTEAQSIVDAMGSAGRISVIVNGLALKHYLHETVETWNDWLKGKTD